MKLVLLSIIFIFLSPFGMAQEPLEGEKATWSREAEQEIRSIHDLANRGFVNEAIERLSLFLESRPAELDAVQLHYDLANLLFLQKRYKEAKLAYEKTGTLLKGHQELKLKVEQRIKELDQNQAKEGHKVDISLIDIKTAVSSGQVPPEGSKEVLEKISKEGKEEPQRQEAEKLLVQIKDLEEKLSLDLLNEARRVFDEEKNYLRVLDLTATLERQFPHSREMPSVLILREESRKRLGQVPSLQEAR